MAFDSVPIHKLIMEMIKSKKYPTHIVNFIAHFLENSYIETDSEIIKQKSATHRVLFSLHPAGQSPHQATKTLNRKCLAYADDFVIIVDNLADLGQTIELEEWFSRNSIKMNKGKSAIMDTKANQRTK